MSFVNYKIHSCTINDIEMFVRDICYTGGMARQTAPSVKLEPCSHWAIKLFSGIFRYVNIFTKLLTMTLYLISRVIISIMYPRSSESSFFSESRVLSFVWIECVNACLFLSLNCNIRKTSQIPLWPGRPSCLF